MAEIKWLRWQRWSKNGMSQFGQMPLKNLKWNLEGFRQKALEILEQTGADHVLYAVKVYDEKDELDLVKFYMEPMDNESYERDMASVSGVVVYAVHKR